MSKVYSKLKSTTCKESTPLPTERFYTIGYTPNGGFSNPQPQLTIKERWLEQIGFFAGHPVIIKVEQDKLIIELAMQI
ncbi:type I toxin-antitoxin system SymE family toxin [Gilliamella sp. W8126]|uniref:Type I toxin-antitoxin system SymE family toxin n=1 Tax=Gilliamella apis TaxID=1970738 RepID=A0A2V4EDA5_9GAMM|nr:MULTISPECIES: SymE family type I addiction module toxin [Gilliamella]MBI0006069.1 type I toxin-antitoxin system SymE family toxin [Gilliamella sp. W8126]PXY92847.1 type I toxin-antitoxin system SymE family toxin [Gilliamella apis]WLS94161.1 SymE family type I addiction module toxin [Gilliamella apis]